MEVERNIKAMAGDLKEMQKSLRKIADNTVSRSCVNIELTYTPREIDRVLFAGDYRHDVPIKDVPGDEIINGSILDFLVQEGLARRLLSLEGRSFLLTDRGYTLKHFGGFTVLRAKEEARIKRQERITIVLYIFGWVFSVIAAILGAWAGSKFK